MSEIGKEAPTFNLPDTDGAMHEPGGGAKKQRREPSGRRHRQNAPSGLGCASANGTTSPFSN